MGSVIDIQKLRIRIPRQEAQKAEIAMARAREIAKLFNPDFSVATTKSRRRE